LSNNKAEQYVSAKKIWHNNLQGKEFFMYFGFDFEKLTSNMKRTILLLTAIFATFLITTKTFAQEDLVRVFRWHIPQDDADVTVADGEYQDGQLINWGWTDNA
jgi:hypothetical protein